MWSSKGSFARKQLEKHGWTDGNYYRLEIFFLKTLICEVRADEIIIKVKHSRVFN